MQWITLSVSTSTGAWAGAKFDVQNGVLGSISQQGAGFTANSSAITPVGNGWYRCVLVYTPGASGSTVAALSGATDGTTFTTSQRGSQVYAGTGSVVFLWGAQLEAGAFRTSYIPTVASQVTRSADVAVMTGTNFSDWYNQTAGSFYAAFSRFDPGTTDRWIVSAYSDSNSRLEVVSGSNIRTRNVVSGSPTSFGSFTAAASGKYANAYQIGLSSGAFNGASSANTTVSTLITPIAFGIGGPGYTTAPLNGHIRQIAYYPRRLANSELRALTA
jgi:hypothetical protein